METIYAKNIYYFHAILEIGGIETFFYYLAKKYSNYDLIIVYQMGNQKQLDRLQKYVRCIKYQPGMQFKCEKAFFNFNTDIIEHVYATKDYYLVLHGDYKAMVEQKQLDMKNLPGHGKITKYIGISKRVCDTWKELTGHDAQLCYNPFMPDEPHKKWIFVSATRLSREKGGGRILKLAEAFDKYGLDYEWRVFSNRTINGHISPHIKIMKPTLNILDEIIQADFLVQLSDNEGYCYSVVEALNKGIPVIKTPIPVFDEIGLNETNSITLNFDCSNCNEVIDKILHNTFDFTYKPKEDIWGELLEPGESQYQQMLKKKYLVSATEAYEKFHLTDMELGFIPKPGHQWIVSYWRYIYLADEHTKYHMPFVKLVEAQELDSEEQI